MGLPVCQRPAADPATLPFVGAGSSRIAQPERLGQRGTPVANTSGMRLATRHIELVKFLAVGTVVFFAGSAVTNYFVSKLLIDLDTIGTVEAAETDEDAPADEEEAATLASATSKPKPNQPSMVGKGTYKQASADAIVANNPFCPTCTPLVESSAPLLADASGSALPMTNGETRSSLPLQLLATMESDDPLWSMATIRDLDNNSLAPYTANEQIRPGVTLLAVERGRVVLLNQGRREFVEIGAAPPPPPAPAPTKTKTEEGKPDSKIAIEGAEEAIDCTDENNCTVDRAFVDQLLAKPQQLMTQARMAPVAKDGETAGFRVSGIKSGSLAKMIGLKNGDVVSEINGQRLGNIDDALAMYQKLRNANHLSVTVERGGALIKKEISIK
jgi:type II secretion system protein C